MQRIQRIILLFLIIYHVLYEIVNATSATTIALLKIISTFSLDRLSAFPIFTFLNAVTAFLKTLSHWTNLPCLYLPSNPIHVFLFVFENVALFSRWNHSVYRFLLRTFHHNAYLRRLSLGCQD